VMEQILTGGLFERGIFHVHSPHVVTKAELVSLISKVYDLGLQVTPVEAKDFCDRSLSSVKQLSRTLCKKSIEQQLTEMRRFFSA
jgi:dTDP-4-dehydrorhamnose reductase